VNKTWRTLNQDGSFNVELSSRPRGNWHRDLYHVVLSASWRRFFGVVALIYLSVNSFFAILYFACGPSALVRSGPALLPGIAGRLLDCFFFSVDTIATLGSGVLVPSGLAIQLFMMFESFTGLFTIALVTGMVFARFARARARVQFSRVAVLSTHDEVPSLVFRLANLRINQIVEAKISVLLTRDEVTAEGERYRNFHELKLEMSRNPIFVLSWTVVHPIDSSSPLHGLKPEDFLNQSVEILAILTGWDETFAQNIHARYSYAPEDIRWNHKFVDILHRAPDNSKVVLHTEKIHDVEKI
jgi:inward rectifier potassium channel